MTENKWTPGPWTTEADPDNESLLVNSMRVIVCGISLWEDDGPEAQARKKADARLIAAAPEMAAYLQECADGGDDDAADILAKVRDEL